MSNYDVVIKKVTTLRVASIRDVVANYGAQGELWGELEAYLAQHNVKPAAPCLTLDHNDSVQRARCRSGSVRSDRRGGAARVRSGARIRTARRRDDGLHRASRLVRPAEQRLSGVDALGRSQRLPLCRPAAKCICNSVAAAMKRRTSQRSRCRSRKRNRRDLTLSRSQITSRGGSHAAGYAGVGARSARFLRKN